MALATMQEECRLKLLEKEEEVKLIVEERELQKMAAVSGLDEQKDELLRQIETLTSVSEMYMQCISHSACHNCFAFFKL